VRVEYEDGRGILRQDGVHAVAAGDVNEIFDA
jgi:hypothetical protein